MTVTPNKRMETDAYENLRGSYTGVLRKNRIEQT